jgi:hypothetical protein
MSRTGRFFMRRSWFYLYFFSGMIFLVLGGSELFGPLTWWRVALAAVMIVCGLWNWYVAWLARARPLITIGEEAIELRSAVDRASTSISRADITGVAWSNPGALCLRLRNDASATIRLIGLSSSDKAVIHDLVGSGRS